MNLFSRDAQSYISRHIYDSDIPINLNSFEFVEDFEKLLLKEFESFKFAFEKLDLPDKNDVIKFWVSKRENEFNAYLEFSPRNLKSFDLAEHYNFNRKEINALDSLKNIPPAKIFYIEHYTIKFTNLIIDFLEFEENYLIEKILNPLVLKIEFNPLELLSIDISQKAYFENKKKDLLIGLSQKYKGNLFWLYDKLGIKKNTHTAVEVFCQELCALYNTEYTDYIRQEYKEVHYTAKDVFLKEVLHLLPEDQKAIIENYVKSIVRK
jgi:hypothetical protein